MSHPYSSNPELRLKQADIICKKLKREGYLPISPLHSFSYIEKEDEVIREEILQVCYGLIDMCDEAWFYKYGDCSMGQLNEMGYCQIEGITFDIKKPPQECLNLELQQHIDTLRSIDDSYRELVNEGWI